MGKETVDGVLKQVDGTTCTSALTEIDATLKNIGGVESELTATKTGLSKSSSTKLNLNGLKNSFSTLKKHSPRFPSSKTH